METGNFRFPFIPELSQNSGLRNKFPNHSISKMEIFFRKNGNPINYDSLTFSLLIQHDKSQLLVRTG